MDVNRYAEFLNVQTLKIWQSIIRCNCLAMESYKNSHNFYTRRAVSFYFIFIFIIIITFKTFVKFEYINDWPRFSGLSLPVAATAPSHFRSGCWWQPIPEESSHSTSKYNSRSIANDTQNFSIIIKRTVATVFSLAPWEASSRITSTRP